MWFLFNRVASSIIEIGDGLFHADADLLCDIILVDIRNRIDELSLNEVILPPKETEFSYTTCCCCNYKGTIILTNGRFTGLGTLHRVGEAGITVGNAGFRNLELTFHIELGVSNPTIAYDFLIVSKNRILSNRSGVSTGTVGHISFSIILSLNVFAAKVRVDKFKFLEIGKINTNTTGMGCCCNCLASKVTSAVVNRMQQEMAHEAEVQIESLLTDVFEKLNLKL